MRIIWFAIAAALLTAGGCTKDKRLAPEAPVAPVDTLPVSDCDSTKVLYCNKVKPIIDANCAVPGCHVSGGSGTGDFSTYAGIKAKVDNGTFETQVFDLMSMPQAPYGPLSASDTTTLRAWLNAGAPQK